MNDTSNTFPINVEQFICTSEACETQIRGDHVVSKIDPRSGERNVRALCQSCGRMHEANYKLGPNGWELIGQVQVVTAENRIKGFKARLAHQEEMRASLAS
jgi:cytochrome c2